MPEATIPAPCEVVRALAAHHQITRPAAMVGDADRETWICQAEQAEGRGAMTIFPDTATAALYDELTTVWGAAAEAYRQSDIAAVTDLIIPRGAPASGVFAWVQHLALIGASKCADELTRINGGAPGGPVTVMYAPNLEGWAVFGDCPRSRRVAAQCIAAAGNGQHATVVDLLVVHLRPGSPRSHTQVAVFLLDAYLRLTVQAAAAARQVTRQSAAVS